jgi:hypothetical protein
MALKMKVRIKRPPGCFKAPGIVRSLILIQVDDAIFEKVAERFYSDDSSDVPFFF